MALKQGFTDGWATDEDVETAELSKQTADVSKQTDDTLSSDFSDGWSTAEPVAEPELETGTKPEDYSRSLAVGLNRFGQTIGRAIDVVGNVDPTGVLDKVGQDVESFYKKEAEEDQAALSPAMQAAQELKYTTDVEESWKEAPLKNFMSIFQGDAWKSPEKVAGSLLQSAPSTIVGMGTGMGITQGLIKESAKLVADKLIKKGISSGLAGVIGGFIGEGGTASIETGKDVYDLVITAPLEVISKTPEYQKAYEALSGEKLTEKEKEKQARELVADHAAMKSMAKVFAATGMLGSVSGHYMGKLIGGEATGGVAKKVLIGAGTEGLQETPQSGFEIVEQNLQKKKFVNPEQDIWEGVKEGSVEGGVQGMAMGGGMASIPAVLSRGGVQEEKRIDNSALTTLKEGGHIISDDSAAGVDILGGFGFVNQPLDTVIESLADAPIEVLMERLTDDVLSSEHFQNIIGELEESGVNVEDDAEVKQAIIERVIPTMQMSLQVGLATSNMTTVQKRQVISDLNNAEDPSARVKAVEQIEKAIENKKVAQSWANTALDKIDKGAEIVLDQSFIDFAAQDEGTLSSLREESVGNANAEYAGELQRKLNNLEAHKNPSDSVKSNIIQIKHQIGQLEEGLKQNRFNILKAKAEGTPAESITVDGVQQKVDGIEPELLTSEEQIEYVALKKEFGQEAAKAPENQIPAGESKTAEQESTDKAVKKKEDSSSPGSAESDLLLDMAEEAEAVQEGENTKKRKADFEKLSGVASDKAKVPLAPAKGAVVDAELTKGDPVSTSETTPRQRKAQKRLDELAEKAKSYTLTPMDMVERDDLNDELKSGVKYSIKVQEDRTISKETTFNENLFVYLDPINSSQMEERMGREKLLKRHSHDNIEHTSSQFGGWRVLYKNDNGDIVGSIQGVKNPNSGEVIVSNAYVRPDFRRKGIGKTLMEEAEKRFKNITLSGDNSITGAALVDSVVNKEQYSVEDSTGSPVTIESVRQAFPGQTVNEGADGSFIVHTTGGMVVTVHPNADIEVDATTASAAYQKTIKPGTKAAGSFQMIGGKAVIQLSKEAGTNPLKHEIYHAAEEMVLTQAEIEAIRKKHGNSEQRAEAYNNWDGETSAPLFQKIKEFFQQVAKALGLKVDTSAADSRKAFGKIESGEVWARDPNDPDGSISVDYSIRSLPGTEKRLIAWNAEHKMVPAAKMKQYIKDLQSVSAMILGGPASLDYIPTKDIYKALKDNSDPHYRKFLDFSTICKKRLELAATLEAIQLKLGRGLTPKEISDTRLHMKGLQQAGADIEVSCGACYVDSARIKIGLAVERFIRLFPDFAQHKEDLLFQRGLDKLKRDNPDVFTKFTSYIAPQNIKASESRTDYDSDILFLPQKLVDLFNIRSGLRWQSWSDFEVPHLIDAMQAVVDHAARGLKAHTYTKVPLMAELFGRTGIMMNMSLIPKGTGVNKDGSLDFDPVEGMPFDVAKELRNRKEHSNTVGTIAIGVTDENILAMMADPDIDFIIPYHKSGLPKIIADREGMEAWQDYTDSQNNKIGDKKLFAKSRFKDIDDFSDWDSTLAWWDVTKTGDENASVYLKTARDAGVKPKFAKFSNKPGYWKTLIDRKMFNNDGAQIIQQALKPVYDMELVNKTISEYQAPRSEADPQIVDDIANTMPKTLSNEEIKTGSHKTQSQHDLLLSKKKSDRSKSEEKRIAGIKDKIKNGVKAETLRSDGAAKKELTKPEQVGLAYLFDLHKAQQMYPGDYDRLMKLYTKAGGQFSFSSPAAGKAEEAEPAQADGEIQYSIRTKPAPKETKKAYKLFRKVGDAAHALFIGRSMPMKEGTWYDAQSPLIKDLEGLPVNKTYLIDKKGNAVTKRFANKQQAPNKKLINEAGLDGTRYVLIKEHKKTGERLYHNWGINGSGGVSTFAMRPGWHSTNVPSARHIGEQVDGKVAYRREDEQWAEIEVSADKDYNEEANSRASKDIPENIPEDGWYSFQTNTNANKAQDWFIGGSIKINRFLSDLEAQEISLADGYEADLPRKNATEVSEAPETSLKQLKEKHSGSIGTILISESGNDIKLASIIVQKDNRKQGVGTAFMNDLVALADSQGKRILLSPGQKDDKHGTSSRSRLVKFYKRFGFVENKGRNKDFQISEGMFRDPADDVSESPDTSKETGPVQETTLGEILNKAQTESVNEGVRKLSKLLGQFIPAEKLKIKVVIDPSARSSSFKSNKNTGFKQITIKSSLKHGVNLHEIVHAVTVLEMNSNPVLRQKVKHLMHQVKTDLIKNGVISKELLDAAAESKTSREFKSNFNGKIDKTVGDIVYAFLNEKEFLAQAFSSNKFQNLLNGIQVRDKGAMKSAWDAFVELVMKGLGINPKHDNAFSEAIKLVAELAGKEATTADTISLENMFSPDWYSRLQGTLQEKGSTQTADQWLKSISSWKKKGTLPAPVQEELEWSGLEDYLAGLGKEKVSREQLAKFVADNGVKLEEVVKQGGNPDGGNPDGDWEDATSEEILEAYMAMTGQTEDEVQWVTEGDMIVELNMELDPSNDAAKFVEYQLPGGKNYKELLITLPKKENTPERKKFESFIGKMETKYGDDWIDEITKAEEDERNILARDSANSQDLQFDSSHYEEANILAHIRFNERLDPDGKKVLFLEEIQSDWHQSGKKKGYKGDSAKFTEKWKDHVEKIEPYVSANNENIAGEDIANVVGDPLVLESIGVPEAIINEGLALVKEMNSDLSSVPNAPFKSTPAWTMLAMKRMIRYATENGFDKVAWTTGEQQAERYDLSKKISRVVYDPNDKTLFAYDLDSKQVMKERNVGEGQIEDHIGKEAARRLTSKENTNLKHESKGGGVNFYEIEGENLKVGGEGMKAFYDKMLPSNTQKFIKQFGGKVENFQVDVGSQDWVSGSMVMDSMGIPEKDQSAYWGNLEAEERDQLQDDYRKEISHSNQQGFSITPAMQESAGMPLFAPKSLEDDVSEAPPGEDSIEGIMSNLRKTATTKADLEKAGIAKEQEIIEQYRKLETLARDPHSSIASKQAMIASFLKVLPVNVRAKVITPLTFISRFLGIGTHTKRMDEALARAEKELVSYLSREIIAGIQKGITPKKLAKNRIKKDTIGPAAARDLQFIRDTLKEEDIEAIAVQVDAQILRKEDELEAATDKEALVIEDELSDLRSHRNIIETFGDLKTQNLEDLLFAKEALNSIVSEGRALWRAQQESFKAALGPVVAKVQQDISGQEDPTVESAAEATKRREKEDTVKGRAKKTWNAVENSILSWEFLMNKLSTLAGDKVLQSYTTKKMLSVAKKATDDEILYKDESDTTIHSKAMEIFNTKKDADLNELFMDQEIKQSGEVFAYGEMGKQLGDFTMSPMEAAYMYAVRKNPDSIPTFEGMHMTDKTFDEIEKFIGPELKAWVDYNVDEYLQDFHYDVNQVYRKVFGTNLSKTPGYISWYRDVPGKVQEKGIAASPSESGTKGMARGAFKERVKNTNPYRMMSFNDVLMKHVDEMNNFRAWAMPTKVINGVFNNRQTQRLITQHHGANLAKNIKQFQTDFTKSPTELRGDLPWLDQLRGNITTAMTALNPTIFLKQLTSIPALAESIPASAWAKNSALFWTNPLKAWNILKDSKTWEGRRQMGMERDIRTAQVVSGSQAIANVRNLKNRAMFLVKWGDGAAILVGGYPVYKYHFDKNLSEMGKAAAHKFALGKFEEAMDRTQQSSGIKDQGNIQRSGSYAKLFTMFITSPKQYTSQITAAIRGIHANPKDGDAYKRLFIFGVLMPSLFKATATGLLGIIGGDDDDKEEFVSGQIKAILTSPLNGIPIVRDLQNAVWESAVGEWYGTDVDYSPATQAGSSLMGAIYHGAKLLSSEEMTPEKKEKHQNLALKNLFETVGYRFGLPANTVRKMVLENWADVASGETDYPIRRSLGFSRYAMGEKASRYTRNKTKVEDATKRREDKEPREGDGNLLKLNGFLKDTETRVRRLKKLKGLAKTKESKDGYSEKIEKVRSQFNNRF